MNSLSTILTIARFEAQTLSRSWFFRIFATLSLVILFLYNLFGNTTLGGGIDSGRLIPGSLPYMNLYLLNVFQAVIAIFLASDFLGRDKKMDTTEAFYVRSVSNINYVIGKTLGIGWIFLYVNLAVLLIGAVFNVIADDVGFVFITYLIYPLLISLPTMLLMVGLSFFIMILVRNQAVTFILMLGFLGASLFYLSNQLYNVFDFIGFNTPMAYSSFVGFPDWTNLLLLRGGYALLGLGFVFFTVLLLPRLPQEKFYKTRIIAGLLLTFVPAFLFFASYVVKHQSEAVLRQDLLKLEESLPHQRSFSITESQLSIEHQRDILHVVASHQIEILQEQPFIFILNPGFVVEQVLLEGLPVEFSRELHTLTLASGSLNPGSQVQVEITYKGKPDNVVTFSDIPEDLRMSRNRMSSLVGGKQVSFVTNDYVLLTREADWYPVSAGNNHRSQPQFTRFIIDARVSPELTVLSQGPKEIRDDGWVRFIPEQPLNALSFVAGRYEIKTVEVDSVEISLAMHSDHHSRIKDFAGVEDTIPHLIREMKADFERKLGIQYPFYRFFLVEVPVHFYTYPRAWTLATDDHMPEYLFVPEGGAGHFQLDPKSVQTQIERQSQRQGEELLPEEFKARLFNNVIGNLLFSSDGGRFWTDWRMRQLTGWSRYLAYPQYVSYVAGVEQEGFPILQFLTENYLFTRLQSGGRGGMFFNEGVNDQVMLKMQEKSFASLLDSLRYDLDLFSYVSRMGAQFFNVVQLNIDEKDVDEVLNEIIQQESFRSMSADDFIGELNRFSSESLQSFYHQWLNTVSMPAYLFGDHQAYAVTEGQYSRYFVRIRLVNNGSGDGLVTIGVRQQERERGGGRGFRGADRGRGRGEPSVEESFWVPNGDPIEIGMLVDDVPRELIINTYISKNIPATRRLVIENVLERPVNTFEGVRPYNGTIEYAEAGTIIVDNEDTGFSTVNQQERRTVKDWWMTRNVEQTGVNYTSVNYWMPPFRWQPVLDENYFGKTIKSAHYKRGGTGNALAKWETELPEAGQYSVYVYIPPMMQRRVRRRSSGEQESGVYQYTIFHDDGQSLVEIEPDERTSGWIHLGDFYISSGNTSVTLSDETTRTIVIADAVKWVGR